MRRALSFVVLLVLVLSTLSTFSPLTRAGSSVEQGQVASVDQGVDLVISGTATGTDGAYGAVNPSYVISDSPWLRLPEDMWDWPPIVPPEPREVGEVEDSTAAAIFNIATREEIRLPSEHSTQQAVESELNSMQPYQGLLSSGGIAPQTVFPPDDRQQITDTTGYPWRTIVKLFMYDDHGNRLGGGSGAIIDGCHVLTAGHCVFQKEWRDAAGNVIWTGWVGSVKVVPGLDGTYMPYGAAWATYIRTYSAWVDHEEDGHDWAVLTLDRNVGLFTGWMGQMTAPWWDSVYRGVLNTAGYPGDMGGLDMYWDSDYGRTATLNRHWYYMDTAPGQSGSPVWVYYSDTGERYILTVHTSGDDGSGSNHGTRLNGDKFDDIITWINEDTPPTDYADLIDDGEAYSGFTPTTVVRAETYFRVWSRVRNIGTASSGGFLVTYYASTDHVIDKDDYRIGTHSVSSISPFAWRDAYWSLGPFPSHIPTGTYFVGVIVDSENQVPEFSELNNNATIWGAVLHVLNNPPVADANGPYYGTEGVPMKFLGYGSYDLDGIVSYEWDFGDGNTGTGVSPTHTYAQEGTYTVTLTVTDNDGATDTDTTTATISEALPWIIEFVDTFETVGLGSSIALDSRGNPHISYYYDYYGYTDTLKYARWTGTAWSVETVDSVAYHFPYYTSIALDSADNPHISYTDSAYLKYARWTGTAWSVEIVDAGKYTSIALDSGDNPHISYYDDYNKDLKYARWTGTAWIIETVDSAGYDVGSHTSIALDSGDNPHISYCERALNYDLKYARWTGTAWSVEIVDSEGDVGEYTSIALDSADNPHISYYAYTNYDLKYARWIGTAWSVEIVDSAGYVGSYSSIALDSWDNPHISYSSQEGLKYTRWNGTAWTIWIVDSAGNVGMFSSLALDSWDNPHISYYDYTNGDLKYATTAPPNQPPVADANGPYTGTEGVPLAFNATASYDPDGYIASYFWDFGDGTTGTGVDPTHTYMQEGTYTVTLTVTDDDEETDTDTTTATISDTEPTADFSGKPRSGPAPLTVNFTDLSTSYDGITSWEWDFDNDGIVDSTIQNPTHVYEQDGVYTVRLTVREADGDNDTETKIDYITVTLIRTPTQINFSLNPNPAIVGQIVTLLGNLTTATGLPISGANVTVKVNGVPRRILLTNSTGWFKATSLVASEGNYTVRVEYAGSAEYLPSYKEHVLVVRTLSISIYTDKYTYHAGDTMHLGLDVTNLGSAKNVCIVIWVELPDGTTYDYKHYHNITLPAGLEYHNPNFQTITLPDIPPGTYIWHATIQDPTTHTILVEDTAQWEFV